jgi:hypothetical protein
MSDSDNASDKKQPWLIPILVAVVTTVGGVVVALIDKPPSQTNTPSSPSTKKYTILANDSTGITISVSKGETLRITASGEVHTNKYGTVIYCDAWAKPEGLNNCDYTKQNSPSLSGLPFMALIGELNDKPQLIGSDKTIHVPTDGTLVLKVNDWDYSSNSGRFDVTVTKEQ